MTEQLSIELLEKTHVFPCPYMFKLIGSQDRGFVARVVAAVREGLQADRDPPYTMRATADGKQCQVSAVVLASAISPFRSRRGAVCAIRGESPS